VADGLQIFNAMTPPRIVWFPSNLVGLCGRVVVL